MLDQGGSLSDRQKDCFSVLTILLALTLRFYKTIFAGVSISKDFLTAHWDSLFYPLREGQSLGMDCSLCDLFIPYRFFVADYWHHGLPLWNQLNGFGMPLLADPQALPFSPLYAIFTLLPSMQTWNFLLIIELAVGAISMYYLCKELQLSVKASLIAALVFIFCPFLQWQLELIGKGICLVPFVFLFFTRMANKGSFWNIVFAGVVAAIDILSSHPEIAFVTILFACLWNCFCCYINDPYAMLSWLKVSTLRLGLAGLIAFGLCAPILIPFGEYVLNAETYKLHANAAAGLPWQAILANYLFPFQPKASIFFGPLALWGVLAAFIYSDKFNRFAKPLLICFIFSIICVVRPTPFNYLFSLPPLSMTFATYWLPEYLLFTSILTGLGCGYLLDKLFDDSLIKDKKRMIALTALGAILLVIPLSYTPWHYDTSKLIFDQTFEAPNFNLKIWVSNVTFALLALIALFATIKQSEGWKIFASSTFVVLGLASLWILSLSALPSRPWFAFPKTLPFTADERIDRILSIGNHLYTPNINLIYGLPSLRAVNPIFPKGFTSFCNACGAQTDQYTQNFPPVISPLLSFAGVNKILSEQPIFDQSILETLPTDKLTKKLGDSTNLANFENHVILSNLQLFFDPQSSAVFLRTKAKLHNAENYRLCFSVANEDGNPIAFSEPVPVSSQPREQELFCSALIPSTVTHWAITLRLMREKDYSLLQPINIAFGKILPNKAWLIATDTESDKFTKIKNERFQLLSKHGSILEYKDKTAFNRYFFVPQINWVTNNSDALEYLKSHKLELNKTAVLEEQDNELFTSALKSLSGDNSLSSPATPNKAEIKDNTFKTVESKDSTVRLVKHRRSRGRHRNRQAETEALSTSTMEAKTINTKEIKLPPPINFETGTIENNLIAAKQPFTTASDFSLTTNATKPAFLVASDIFYPGWNVYIDGKQSSIFRTDYLFRGIIVPSGKHTIRFVYQPITLTIGFWLFFITIETIFILGLKHQYWSKGKALTFKQSVPIKI